MLSTFLYKGVPTQLPEKVAETEAFAANSSEPSKLFIDSFLILPLSLKQLL